jgi:hypothetical protein
MIRITRQRSVALRRKESPFKIIGPHLTIIGEVFVKRRSDGLHSIDERAEAIDKEDQM